MKYLRKFDNHAAYAAAESGLILPNVSLCVNENEVHYNPSTPPAPPIIDGHEYVEIGGIKWATMNVGATAITDTGLYFQWGDTQGYTAAQVGSGSGEKNFSDEDYKYYYNDNFTKYDNGDGKTILEASDDAVVANWGGSWRMPTVAEFQTLGAAVNTAWTQVNGVSGIMCTDKSDETKTLFFPACGNARNGSVSQIGSSGYYSSSSLSAGFDGEYFYEMTFGNGFTYWDADGGTRFDGNTIRGVVG